MKKRLVSLALSFCLMLSVCSHGVLAVGADEDDRTQTLCGAVNSSDLLDNAIVELSGDTVLTVDADKTVYSIIGEYELTIRGDHTLNAMIIRTKQININAGTICLGVSLDEGAIVSPLLTVESMIMSGGKLIFHMAHSPINADTMVVNGGIIDLRTNISDGQYDALCGICADKMTVNDGEVYAYGHFTGIAGSGSWMGLIYGCDLTINGGYVETYGIHSNVTGWTIGATLAGLTVSGGELKAQGSDCAINCWDSPVVCGENARIKTPVGAYVSTETTESAHGWTGYSVYNEDGSRATEVSIIGSDEPSGGSERYYINVSGLSASLEDYTVIVGYYEKSGRMIAAQTCGLLMGNETDEYIIDVAKPPNEYKTSYLFIVDTNYRPVCGKISGQQN